MRDSHLPQMVAAGRTLADTVAAWRDYAPTFLPLPHPSPRNPLWLARRSGVAPAAPAHCRTGLHALAEAASPPIATL
ncbi:hypothetical protein [Chitinolyticbacter meiyuanensis]|uniref:hypothetical protein n=1 Tax=Chitinolyticbacter meiyuanensis TaxID=682798 RepID=UPI001C9E642B|nr:hypothetical protein [Chitinolyticbacter meiyuanensis]